MKTGRPVEVAPILREIHETLAEVGVLLERAGASPPALPEPSRRAYQWLSFLAEPENLRRHQETLAAALAVDPRVSVDVNHIAALYSAWRQDDRVSLTVSEAFVGAPAEVIQGLVKLALPHTRKRPLRARIAAYAESERFKARLREVEASGEALRGDPAGEHVSLTEVFDQVNRVYFDNSLAKPRLAWSRTITGREFGNYQPSTDVLTVSLALDAPGVPAYVVEFVMFHELLHKAVGIEVVNGRRQAHTARFRRRERRFARYPEAEAFLKALAERP